MKPSPQARVPPEWKALPKFRVLDVGMTIDPAGATYGPRVQNHYEFIWIMEGRAKATYDRDVLPAREGSILFRRPGVKDYYEWAPDQRTVHAFVHFDLEARRRIQAASPAVPALREMPPNDIFRPLFGYLLSLNDLPEPSRSELMLPALDLMFRSYISGEVKVKSRPAAQMPEAVERAIGMIRANVAQSPPDPLQLKQLSEAAHTTPENLCRQFKKFLRLGPLEYAKLARLDRAASQLRRTTASLKEVALSTGFYDAYHFSRSFKQVYGMSPKEFRKTEYNEWLSQKNPIIQTFYHQ